MPRVTVIGFSGEVLHRGEAGKVVDKYYVMVDDRGPYNIANVYLAEHEDKVKQAFARMKAEEKEMLDRHMKETLELRQEFGHLAVRK